MPYHTELNLGAQIAREAGALALRIRQGDIGIESKSDESPVTIADKACEKLIVERLQEYFPADGLLGEEGSDVASANGRRWIIDPIDGTRDFIRGTGAWSVLIGLEENGQVVAGHAYFPATNEMFSAARGTGAWWGGQRARCSSVTELSQALVCCNGLSYMHRYPFGARLVDWLAGCWTVRSMGGCLDAMLLVTGRADIWLEAQAKPWDLAPLKILADEAGLVTFDFTGQDTIYGGNYAITVPALKDAVLELVSQWA